METTISLQVERQHSIKILDFLLMHYGHFWQIFAKLLKPLDIFLPKMTIVRPESVTWRNNQKWCSIRGNMVHI